MLCNGSDSLTFHKSIGTTRFSFTCKGSWYANAIDKNTRDSTMGYFARVCVDVDLSADRVEEILIEREQVGSKDIYLFKQVMIYEKPTERCGYCTKYGHMIAGCLKRKDDEGKKTKIIIKDLGEHNNVHGVADMAANLNNVDANHVVVNKENSCWCYSRRKLGCS
ncbi:hypothetical protein AMTRI_Chr08g163920 [Amborella trichopoda]